MNRDRMLAVITVLLSAYALRLSYPVTMPVAAAAVVIAAVWPVKPWLDRILPKSIATTGTVIVLLVVLLAFLAALYFSAAQVVRAFANNQTRIEVLYGKVSSWADGLGLNIVDGQTGYDQLLSWGRLVLANLYSVLVYVGLVGIFVSLALPEVPLYHEKLGRVLGRSRRQETTRAIGEIASKIRSYFAVTTLASLLTGLASGVWAAIMGVDLALVWGILNFLLNYIPVVGNIIGIVPPTVFAFVQFGGWMVPSLVFIGFCIIQIAISNFVAPRLQGHALSLSPTAIIVALSFWSWIWGIAGALIAVPLTAALMIVCEHFESTQWVAALLSGKRRPHSE